MAEPARLQPRTDISVRTMLARFETALDGLEERTSLRFDQLSAGHARLDGRLDKIEGDVATTKEAVARIEGERTAERRAKPDAPNVAGARRVTMMTSIVVAGVAVLGFLSTAWGWLIGHPVTHAN